MDMRKIVSSQGFWVILYAAAMAMLPLLASNNYYVKILIVLGINTIIVIGLNLLMGQAGQVSIGHAAFYGIGAYATAIATTKYQLTPVFGLAASIVLGGLIAYVIAIPTLRLKGHYLAMATLGFAEIVHVLFLELREFTGGTDGLYGIPSLSLFGYEFSSPQQLYSVILVILVISLVLALNLVRTRVGRALQAVHGSEIAASAMGIDTSKYKIQVFVLSAVLACVGGSLYAHMAGYVSPDSFTIGVSITLVAMVVFGGMSNVWGAIVGATILTILQEYLKEYQDLNMVFFGAILILSMIFMPKGIVGSLGALLERVKRRTLAAERESAVIDAVGDNNAAS